MPRALSKFYNWRTRIWHRWLRRPIRLKVALDNKVKHPRLTVVFLHGISATSETWRTTIRQFSANPDLKGVRMVALDLLGFGKSLQSNWLDYDYLDYEKSPRELSQKTQNYEPSSLSWTFYGFTHCSRFYREFSVSP